MLSWAKSWIYADSDNQQALSNSDPEPQKQEPPEPEPPKQEPPEPPKEQKLIVPSVGCDKQITFPGPARDAPNEGKNIKDTIAMCDATLLITETELTKAIGKLRKAPPPPTKTFGDFSPLKLQLHETFKMGNGAYFEAIKKRREGLGV